MINALVINKKDNVCIIIEPAEKNSKIIYKDENAKENIITAKEDIPIYHKVAIRNIEKNEYVIKYGEHIGVALQNISIGEHVHEHNIEGRRENLETT